MSEAEDQPSDLQHNGLRPDAGDGSTGKGPKQGQGKFVAQIKKNLSSKNPVQDPGKQPAGNKTSASSVVSRLTEPTISSAQKSVKAEASKPPKTAPKPTVNGKSVSTGKAPAKESLPVKKTSSKEKISESAADSKSPVENCTEEPSESVNFIGGITRFAGEEKPRTEDDYTTRSEALAGDSLLNDIAAIEARYKAEEERESENVLSVADYAERKNAILSRDKNRQKVPSSSPDTDYYNINRQVCEPSFGFTPSLKDQFFGQNNQSNLNGSVTMATADAQVESPSEQAPTTEILVISNGKVKYINTNYKKTGHKMYDYKCDIKLKVADENFKAHREVLSEASDYFSAMFSHNMKEKEQDVIELKEISPKGFAAILDYFYHGYVTLEPGNIQGVIEAARFFHVDWLLEVCCNFLIRHLSLENYSDVIQLSDKYWLGDLRWDIFRFLGQNLEELSQQENFLENLSLELLLQFLMENIYTEPPESFLLELVLRWIKCDEANRKEHLLSLLRQIRFPVMELEELENIPEEVLQYPDIKTAVKDAIDYNLNVMGQCLKQGDMYLQRGARPVITVLSFTNEANLLVYRDPTKSGLFVEELGPAGLDTASYQAMGQSKIGNFLYAAGGYDDAYNSVARVFRFDPKYRDWTEVAGMNQSRVSFAMCNSDNRLYVVGGVHHAMDESGTEAEEVLSSVEMYNPEENAWRNLQDIPVKTSNLAAVVVNGCLYVSGGISADADDPVPLDTMWCLNLDGTEGWVPKQSMRNGRHSHSLTFYNGKIYAVGGYTVNEDRITFKDQILNEAYDLETGQWTEVAPTPEVFGHLFPYCEVLYDQLFVMGGIHVNMNLYTYDPESDNWEEIDVIGPNVQKLAALSVAYPYTS